MFASKWVSHNFDYIDWNSTVLCNSVQLVWLKTRLISPRKNRNFVRRKNCQWVGRSCWVMYVGKKNLIQLYCSITTVSQHSCSLVSLSQHSCSVVSLSLTCYHLLSSPAWPLDTVWPSSAIVALTIIVREGARIKYKLMGFMVYF
jgi:hypothetical protein